MAEQPDPAPQTETPARCPSSGGAASRGEARARDGLPAGVPERLGGYRLVRRIGSGGMGAVYLAEEEIGSRVVALKVIRKTGETSPTLVRRFLAEAENAFRLRHPNIVAVQLSGEQRAGRGRLFVPRDGIYRRARPRSLHPQAGGDAPLPAAWR